MNMKNKNSFVIDVDGFNFTPDNVTHDMIKRAIGVAVHECAYSEREEQVMLAELNRLIGIDRSKK